MTDWEIYEDNEHIYYIIDGAMYVKIEDKLVEENRPWSLLVPENSWIREICEENFSENFEEVSKLISKVKKQI